MIVLILRKTKKVRYMSRIVHLVLEEAQKFMMALYRSMKTNHEENMIRRINQSQSTNPCASHTLNRRTERLLSCSSTKFPLTFPLRWLSTLRIRKLFSNSMRTRATRYPSPILRFRSTPRLSLATTTPFRPSRSSSSSTLTPNPTGEAGRGAKDGMSV